MSAHLSLKIETSKYQVLRERLLADWPTIEEECLLDTLEGITDLHEMIAAVIRSALVDEALHAGLRFRLDDMKQRLSRLEVRAAKKRQLALEAMTEVGLNKLEQPDFTASARAGSPALIVIAEEKIPDSLLAAATAQARSPDDPRRAQAWRRDPRCATEQPQTSADGEDQVMALSDTQVRQLRAKLEAKHVKTRKANGADLHYVEGWHVIAEANRIFGYDAWDRRTLASRCVWSGANGAYHEAAYTAKVRVSVRAGDITIVREGSGSGEAKAPTPGQAHELALKGAETDATKRALATFGNPFGLALYDREQIGVRKARGGKAAPAIGPWVLRSASGGEETSFDQPSAFAAALRQAMSEARDIELLFAIWEQNVETVRALNRSLKQDSLPRSGIAPQLVAHLKHCAVALVKPETRSKEQLETTSDQTPTTVPAPKSTRACLPSANQNGSAPRSICALWPSNPVSFAGDRRAMPITSASPNPGALGSRSATNSRYRSAPSTISRTTHRQ